MTELKDSRFTISIHALREEGDHTPVTVRPSRLPFLSTPSARRATRLCVDVVHHGVAISIHALREEGDALCDLTVARAQYFYPRPPRGGRRALAKAKADAEKISIHALREEGD